MLGSRQRQSSSIAVSVSLYPSKASQSSPPGYCIAAATQPQVRVSAWLCRQLAGVEALREGRSEATCWQARCQAGWSLEGGSLVLGLTATAGTLPAVSLLMSRSLESQVRAFRVAELKECLARLGLTRAGRKLEQQQRLLDYLQSLDQTTAVGEQQRSAAGICGLQLQQATTGQS